MKLQFFIHPENKHFLSEDRTRLIISTNHKKRIYRDYAIFILTLVTIIGIGRIFSDEIFLIFAFGGLLLFVLYPFAYTILMHQTKHRLRTKGTVINGEVSSVGGLEVDGQGMHITIALHFTSPKTGEIIKSIVIVEVVSNQQTQIPSIEQSIVILYLNDSIYSVL
ncbi:MAG: hypothetical protein AAFV93_13485 [Chloroflexota bacterium]